MTDPGPAEIGGRYRLTPARSVPPPLEPLAAVDLGTGAACAVWFVPSGLFYHPLARSAADFAGLRHPSLQSLLGVFAAPGGAGDYWVYEGEPGESFEALALAGQPFTEAQALDMAASLAGALRKLHGAGPGASHGSISPANLYLAGDGRAVLGGVKPFSRRVGGESPYDPTAEHGTPSADIYSLGASLVFLLTGKKPAPGGASGDLDKKLPFSPGFLRVIKKMTAPDASERYGSCAGLAADLAVLLSGRPVSRRKRIIRAAALCSLLAASGWGARAFLTRSGADKVLKGGAVGWAEPGGLHFSPDGGLLALAGDTKLYLWKTGAWKPERTNTFLNGRGKHMRSAAFLPDGGLVIGSSTGEGVSDLRRISPGRSVLWETRLPRRLDSAAVSPDGGLIAAAVNDYDRTEQRHKGGRIILFDADGKELAVLAASPAPVFSVRFAAGGERLLYKTYLWDEAAKAYNLGRIVSLDRATGNISEVARDKPGYGSGLFSYSPAGFLVLPVGNSEVLAALDLSGKPLARLNEDSPLEKFFYTFSSEGAFSADGALFAAPFTSRNTVYARLFETSGWKLLKTFRLGSLDRGGVAALSFSPDGKILAVAQGNAFGSKVYIFGLEGVGG